MRKHLHNLHLHTRCRYFPLFPGLLLAFSGCGADYKAATLPAEFRARPVVNTDVLSISSLGVDPAANELLFPGDLVAVQVSTGMEARAAPPWQLRIDDRGMIEVPLVGVVEVAGQKVVQAEQLIRQAGIERGVYRNPTISLRIEGRRVHRVTVAGAVNKPSTYELPAARCDLFAAILAAGGVSDDAQPMVELRNHRAPDGGVQQASFDSGSQGQVDFVDLQTASSKEDRYPLADGAVVTVLKREPRNVHVMGLVNRPNQVTIPPQQDIRVLDAVSLAGGISNTLADKVYVVRQRPEQGDSIVIRTSLRQAKKSPESNLLLMNGDLVSVEETPLTFTTGTLRRLFNIGVGVSGNYRFF